MCLRPPRRTRLYSRRNFVPIGEVIGLLKERGLVDSHITDERGLRDHSPNRVYCSLDPTANSLHLGDLLGLIVLSWFIRCGHGAVALVCGHKRMFHPELDPASLDRNVGVISASIRSICSSNNIDMEILNNNNWWEGVKSVDFLRKNGGDKPSGLMEINYDLFKRLDFLHLFREKGVNVYFGGSDEMSNIIHLLGNCRPITGAAFPLLLTRSEDLLADGTICLSPAIQLYHYFLSISDVDVVSYLKALTFLSMDEISSIESDLQSQPNYAQRRLAEEVTRFVHGEEGLAEALKAESFNLL